MRSPSVAPAVVVGSKVPCAVAAVEWPLRELACASMALRVCDCAADDAAEPAAGAGAPVDADDLNSKYHLDHLTDTFALQNWRLDTGTFDALKTSLPACTSLTTLKYG